MHRQPLLELLADYHQQYPGLAVTQDFIRFVEAHDQCFERSLSIGHITGSAWILDRNKDQVLLVHHRKLDLWLQPGGHCDGNADVAGVAEMEAREETGITDYEIFKNRIFDLDIHAIPRWKGVPEHFHYDLRFLIYADSQQAIQVSEESHAVAWFELEKLSSVTEDASVLRLADKTKALPKV